MSTSRHTPIEIRTTVPRIPANAATFNAPLSQLDTAIVAEEAARAAAVVAEAAARLAQDNLILSSAGSGGWASTLDAEAASGQKVVPVVSTAGAVAGMPVYIGLTSGTHEVGVIDTISAGVSVTLVTNLTSTYNAPTPISATPAEVRDARGVHVTLGDRLDALETFPGGATLPGSGTEGDFWYLTTVRRVYQYLSGVWVDIHPPALYQARLALGASQATIEAKVNGIIAAMKTAGMMDTVAPTYDALQLAMPDLVAYWKMTEAGGATLVDELGALDGVWYGGPTFGVTGLLTGETDKAITFNGTTQYGYVPHAPSLDLGDKWGIIVWFNHTNGATYRALCGHGALSFEMQVTNANKLALLKAGVQQLCDSGSALAEGRHFAVGTKDGASIHLYLDGVDVTANVVNATCTDSGTGIFSVAQSGSGSEYNPGTEEKLALVARAVDPEEQAALWAIGSGA